MEGEIAEAGGMGLLAMAALMLTAFLMAVPAQGQPAITAGQSLYEARCGGCHAIDRHQIGPLHRGVVGRRAGSVPGYAFSPALRRYGQIWTPALLDRWLANPRGLVPGTRMGLMVSNAADRQAIIDYLVTQRLRSPNRR